MGAKYLWLLALVACLMASAAPAQETKAKSSPEAKAKAEPEAKAVPEPKAEPEAKAKDEPEAKAQPEAKAPAEAEAEAKDEHPKAKQDHPKSKGEADGKGAHEDHAADEHAAEEHGAGGHGAGGHGHLGHDGLGEVSPSDFKPDLALFTFCVFLGLMAILWKFAWKPITTALDQREDRIDGQIKAAEKINAEAKALLAQYEQKLAGAQDDVRAIIEEARKDAEHTRQELQAKAESEVQALRDRTLRDLDTARAQALKELAEHSTNLAIELAGKLVGAQLNHDDHRRLIEQTVNEFPQGGPQHN